MALLEVHNLHKDFGGLKANDDISFNIEKGELMGLIGPNGAGKTTVVNILCGLTKPTNGTAKVGGYDVQKETAKVKELIGVCLQETAIYHYLTGVENVELFGNLHVMKKEMLKKRRDILLENVGLTGDAKRRTAKYSGGMKRRLSLILALIHNPQIAFLDEPTVGMDPKSRRDVWSFIKELKKQGKTIILTTHYMEEAEELCDRVGIIDHGKLIALGSPEELISINNVKDLEEVFINITGRKMLEEV